MSFFWSSYISTPPSTPVVKKVEEPDAVVEEQPTPTTPIPTPTSSSRSVPTADAFRQPQVTRVPRKKVDLTVDVDAVAKTRTVSIAEAETPLNSGYNSPKYDVQFMPDENVYDVFVYSEPCTPTYASAVFPLAESTVEVAHRLEHLFERGLYHHQGVVHQGVYNDSVLHGGYTHVPGPDRDELDVNSNVHLHCTRDVSRDDRVMELHRNYLDLIAQNHQILQRLEALTSQLGSELCI